MKQLITILFFVSAQICQAQVVADFENFEIPQDTFLNKTEGNIGFQSGNVLLPNDYSLDFSSWTGWAISSTQDDTTPGFLNQYSAITAGGVDESPTYAVSFSFDPNIIQLQNDAVGKNVGGLYITNSTYPYLSMRDGDAFAKKFGGISGDDPDFFLLTIKKYAGGTLSEDSINFYLADYRFVDNSQDYLVNDWTFVDLSNFGPIDSLWLALSSSDVGMFGMNTPAYFCIDNIMTAGTSTAVTAQKVNRLQISPSPSRGRIRVNGVIHRKFDYSIYDMLGRKMMSGRNMAKDGIIEVAELRSGTYVIQIQDGLEMNSILFIKQ